LPTIDVAPVDELPPNSVKIVNAGSITVGVYNCFHAASAPLLSFPQKRAKPRLRLTNAEVGCARCSARNASIEPTAFLTALARPGGAVQSAAKGGFPEQGLCGFGGWFAVNTVIPTTAAAAPAVLSATNV
jgi:hypothetical protein